MESKNEEPLITFKRLQKALIIAVNTRILNGDYTERGLARILGVSQPQIHNVLKGARKLTPELSDRILLKLNINLLELISKDKYGDKHHKDRHDVGLRLQRGWHAEADKSRKPTLRRSSSRPNMHMRLVADDAG